MLHPVAQPWPKRMFTHPGLWLALIVGLGLKAALLATGSITFNSDEAILALMARHILRGALPIFFYGQSYMGALDAYLVAGSFFLLGENVMAARLVQLLLYLGVLLSTHKLALRVSQDRFSAAAAALLIALPPVLFSLYTTAGIGDYVEVLLFNNLLWWLGWDLFSGHKQGIGWWSLAGLVAGVGWWSMASLAASLIPLLVIGAWALWRKTIRVQEAAIFTLSFLVGAAPWLWATLYRGPAAVLADLGGARVSEIPTGPFGEIGQRILNLLLFNLTALFGLRPPWSPDWIALPIGIFIGGFYLFVLWRSLRHLLDPDEERFTRITYGTLVGAWLVIVLAFVLTPFGRDPTGRYVLHLYPPFAILTGEVLGRAHRQVSGRARRVVPGLLIVILAYNLWGNLRSMLNNPPGLTTQFDLISHLPHDSDDDLIAFLDTIGADRGYSNYWLVYRFAFLTGERILFSPRLPYKADLSYTYADDRYPPYSEAVYAAQSVVYVTSNLPALDARLAQRFDQLGVAHQVERIGPYTVFYDLSRPVTPEDLGPFGLVSSSSEALGE